MFFCDVCFPTQKINEKPQVINDYEGGRAIPNNQIMTKIEKAIGKVNLVVPIYICKQICWINSCICIPV